MTVDLPWPALIFMGTGTTAVRCAALCCGRPARTLAAVPALGGNR